MVLVSDAISPYGLNDGLYEWDKRVVRSEQGSCRLEDGTLAGSTLSLLEACKNLAIWTGQPSSAIWAATIAPRIVLETKQENNDFLLGKSLKQLLRWRINSANSQLEWQRAA